jgi:hypothetical protein
MVNCSLAPLMLLIILFAIPGPALGPGSLQTGCFNTSFNARGFFSGRDNSYGPLCSFLAGFFNLSLTCQGKKDFSV